jgi:cell division protein FtsW
MFYNAALKRTTLQPYDMALFWVVTGLLALGLVMVYSSSISIAEARTANHSAQHYLLRHSVSLLIAITAAMALFRLPSAAWQKAAPILFLVSTALLVLVFVPGIGREVKGSWRWISLGPLGNFQPSELMKLATVIYAADYTVRKAALMGSIQKGFLPMFLVMLLITGLLQMEPDLGATLVIVAIAMGILFLGGLNLRLFLFLLVLVVLGVITLVQANPYRLVRMMNFMDPWGDPLGAGYQVTHALMAVGRGGWLGVGLGESVEKLAYLPEAHTDFLIAILGEELGALGIVVVMGLFAWVIWRAISIGWQASLMGRNFQALVAQGVAVWLGAQCFINIGVNLGALPAKGLTLPLMSYGGSGLLVNCLAIALVLRVDYENRLLMRGGRPA